MPCGCSMINSVRANPERLERDIGTATGRRLTTGLAGTETTVAAYRQYLRVVSYAKFISSPAALAASIVVLALHDAAAWAADADEKTKLEEVVIAATRSPMLIRDEPLRVEAVPAEEIEENLTIQPGNVTSLFGELPGIRMQSSGPGLGGTVMQLRGMPGRHSLVLADGLPLLGAEPDAFGLLQTPPLDLARVEIIKGAVSALYGGTALGGILNPISRTPDSESAILGNVTSRGGRDLVGFLTHKDSSTWSGTLTAGAHDQFSEDVDRDGWADLPAYRRYTLRPRLWWDGGNGRSLYLTGGLVDEDRSGGTLPGRVLADRSIFPEALHTHRIDMGVVSHITLGNGNTLSGRYSFTTTRLNRRFGADRVDSAQTTVFVEEALNGFTRGHHWVLGAAFVRDELAAEAVPGVSYAYNVPGLFAQDTLALAPWATMAGSVRFDAHNQYGAFFSPRLSALIRQPGSAWSLRASIGAGFAAPSPFVDEVEATSLARLLPLRGLRAERAVTASLDAKWAAEGWDVNFSVFNSDIRNPLTVADALGTKLELVNGAGSRRAPGVLALQRSGRTALQGHRDVRQRYQPDRCAPDAL